LRGLEAVVDKDRASALLAEELGVSRLIITTGVDGVWLDFLTEHKTRLERVTATELKRHAAAGQFPPGSMGPKVEAALRFLDRGGDEVVICSTESLAEAFAGRAGTIIRKG
jgi:carbamate kinase